MRQILFKRYYNFRTRLGTVIREHVILVEKAMGKPLPPGAVVHHVDHQPFNNDNNNLVACQNAAYHVLLHVREKALNECGNPNLRQCIFCKIWSNPAYLKKYPSDRGKYFHRDCERLYHRTRYAEKPEYFKAQHKRVLDKMKLKKQLAAQ